MKKLLELDREDKWVNGYNWEWNKDLQSYDCRGDVCHDEEHDECPDPDLWRSGKALVKSLKEEGFKKAFQTFSEKGWQEVYLN